MVNRFKLTEGYLHREGADGSVILMKMDDSDLFYKIDGLAAHIFMELKEGKNTQEATELVANKFNVTELERLTNDTLNLIKDLQDKSILEEALS